MLDQMLAPSIYLIYALGFGGIWFANRHMTAAGIWAVGYFVPAIGFIFEIPLSVYPDLTFLRPIIDACYLAGGLLLAIGLSFRFMDRYPKSIFIGSYLALYLSANWAWFAYDSYNLRSEIICYGSALLMLMGAGYAYPKMNSRIEKFLFWAVVAFSVQFAMTCFISVHILNESISENSFQSSSYIDMLSFTVAITSLLVVILQLVHLGTDVITRLRREARTDPLTGLRNRRAFEMPAQSLMNLEDKSCLILCDIDHFKKVNDMWGHTAGDEVLRYFANMLEEICPNDALLGRLGGEEFGIFLPKRNLKEGREIAEKIRCAFLEIQCPGIGTNHLLSVSLGVAELSQAESYESAFDRADAALYSAKRNGRNCVKSSAYKGRGDRFDFIKAPSGSSLSVG